MKRILQIVDSVEYVRNNCFQHQLAIELRRKTDYLMVPLSELRREHLEGRTVLSTLKLRSLCRSLFQLAGVLDRTPVYVYEQDSWESLSDFGEYRGAYEQISNVLNVSSFLTTSKWWSDLARSRGLKSTFVKIWLLPEYCDSTKSFEDRTIRVGFMGRMHPHRESSLRELHDRGIDVVTLPSASYQEYLTAVSDMRFFLHDEPPRWRVDGKTVECQSLWGKDVEVMGRGTFCFRNREMESAHWNLKDNPLLLEFSSYDEIVEKIRTIEAMQAQERNIKIRDGVESIRIDTGWNTVIEALR